MKLPYLASLRAAFSPLAAIAALFAAPAYALTPGDIAIIGRINNTTPDAVVFVALADIPAGTIIHFTDNGWGPTGFRGVTDTDGNGNEDLMKFTANQLIPAGTIVNSTTTGNPAFTWTTSGTIPGTTTTYVHLAQAVAGDQIYAFEGPATDPALNPTTHLFVIDDTNGFEDATSSNNGGIPPGLALGSTAVTVNASTGGTIAVNPTLLGATGNNKAAWLAIIGNPANWQTSGATLPSGTISVDTGGGGGTPTVAVTAFDAAASEAGANPGTFRLTRTGTTTADLTIYFSVSGSASNGSDYTPALSGSAIIPMGASSLDLVLTPVDDLDVESDETILLTLTAHVSYAIGSGNAATITIADNDAPIATLNRIHQIQGAGTASPLVGQIVTIQGVVVGAHQSGLGGFFVQEEDADADSDPATSEGIFVFSSSTPVAVGDLVTVKGTVTEFFNLTEITTVTSIVKDAIGVALPTAAAVALPMTSSTGFEPYEGMRVNFTQTLYVTNTFDLHEFGEFDVSSGGVLKQPTNIVGPGAPAAAAQAANNLNRLTIDDGANASNPSPTPFLFGGATATENTLRLGDTVTGATGILTYQFGSYALHPSSLPLVRSNPRPPTPNVGRGLRIISANVLNYFNGNGTGGGFPTSRGADSAAEFARQRAHIVTMLTQATADIIGVIEIENDGFGATSAIQDLVNGLNTATAPNTFAFINLGGPVGTDEITCGFIYRRSTIQPLGAPAVNMDPVFNRPPIAQTWRSAAGEVFTVTINHFKSKGGGGSGPDADLGDGQGSFNLTRTEQAAALVDWLATRPTGNADPDILIIGDLNAYAKEDPITTIRAAGYVDLFEMFEGVGGYSYSFDGQSGHLDQALASDSFYRQTLDAKTWHTNADEPTVLDYNVESKSTAQQAMNNGSTPWRASDHDPLVIGFKPGRPIR